MSPKPIACALAALGVVLMPIVGTAQRSGTAPRAATPKRVQNSPAAAEKLPPLSYVCPMPADADVLEDKPGNCPKCNMKLQPIRLDLRYACPVHQTYIQDKPGTHAYDGRELVPVTVSVFWSCGDQKFLEPGKCSDGSARKEGYELRPHGDHNPKHGGQFFMAPDAWHHLEGTYPTAGLFRLYFYNDYSKPLTPTGFAATVSVLDANDKELAGLTDIPLKRGRISNTMEAPLPKGTSTPVRLLARVKFGATSQPNPFNFIFTDITREPAPTPSPTTATTTRNDATSGTGQTTGTTQATTAGAPGRPTPGAAGGAGAATTPSANAATSSTQQQTPAPVVIPSQNSNIDLSQAPSALVAALDESVLPTATPDLVAELLKRAGEVEQTVKEGNLGQVWLPAMSTKTAALALESHTGTLPESQRVRATVAIKRVVTSAWELDAYGDLGNKQKMTEAYEKLAAAVADLKAVYGSR